MILKTLLMDQYSWEYYFVERKTFIDILKISWSCPCVRKWISHKAKAFKHVTTIFFLGGNFMYSVMLDAGKYTVCTLYKSSKISKARGIIGQITCNSSIKPQNFVNRMGCTSTYKYHVRWLCMLFHTSPPNTKHL